MRRILVLMSAAMLASCAGPTIRGAPGDAVTLVPGGTLPTPNLAQVGGEERPYFVGPFDRLDVTAVALPELGQASVQVDASGRISLPFVGILKVSGLTPLQIEEQIKNSLRGRYLRNPQVSVNLREMVSQTITVTGEVRNPGIFPVVGKLTLLRAITVAKGTTEFSRLRDVVVFREVDGRRYAALYDLKAIQDGRYPDPEVFANDVVRVGDSESRRLFRDFITLSPLISGPIILLLKSF